MVRSIDAVSYTHLDVYKRQAQMLSSLSYDCPIVIAGNRCAAEECQEILGERTTFLCENVNMCIRDRMKAFIR